jgi:hypothetical protein
VSGAGAVAGLLAVLLLAGAGPGGCSADREVAVRSLGSGQQCGGSGEGPSARRLTSSAEVAAALSPGLGAAVAPPAVNWGGEAVLLVSGGQHSTPGFGVELGATRAQVKDGAAGLQVRFSAPPAGLVGAQLMTSPCLLVALPREGIATVALLDGTKVVALVKLD